MKPQSTELRKSGHVFIAMPTLEIMLLSCKNRKEQADIANMEYSNFIKHCKMRTDIRLDTYARCASAFDMDVLLVHFPKGIIDSLVKSDPHESMRFSAIEKEDLAIIMNNLLSLDHKVITEYFISNLYNVKQNNKADNDNDIMPLLINFLQQIIEIYGKR
jgi:hypothetical protein